MSKRQAPRRALVTGASSGIGLHLARRLAARGIEVWLAARRQAILDAEVDAIRKSGGRAHALVLDVADVDAVVERLGRLDDDVGGIDLVVANAGIAGALGAVPVSQARWSDVRAMLHTNLLGAAATIQPFIARMVARGRGQLVGVSSLSADCPVARGAAYGAGKAGLSFYLESVDLELRARGVDVTIVHPGFVSTPAGDELVGVAPRPLLMSADEAARIIDRAIIRRRRLVRFPWVMGVLARVSAWLPRWLMAPLIRRASQ